MSLETKILFGLIASAILGMIMAIANIALYRQDEKHQMKIKGLQAFIWLPYWLGLLWYWFTLLGESTE